MRADVRKDWEWADGYQPEVRRILIENLPSLVVIEIATEEQDLKQATDMTVKILGDGSIPVRVRNTFYRDLTLRAWRKSGAKTELAKIIEGYGDYYLYGWANENARLIPEWILVDLDATRASGLLVNPRTRLNDDGLSSFAYIHYTVLERAGCIINACIAKRLPVPLPAPPKPTPPTPPLQLKQLKLFT